MIALQQTAAVLLCAGHSRRFEGGEKLLVSLSGKPLVAHAASMLASLPFASRVATVRANQPALHNVLSSYGFDLLEVGYDVTQQQSALAGTQAAIEKGARAICLMLGDMPFVAASHIEALAAATSETMPTASQGDGWIGPPWIASTPWVRANASSLKAAVARDALALAPSEGALHDIDCRADMKAGS
jgi:CTP:molybdopterin cytidylyltransferase MocA